MCGRPPARSPRRPAAPPPPEPLSRALRSAACAEGSVWRAVCGAAPGGSVFLLKKRSESRCETLNSPFLIPTYSLTPQLSELCVNPPTSVRFVELRGRFPTKRRVVANPERSRTENNCRLGWSCCVLTGCTPGGTVHFCLAFSVFGRFFFCLFFFFCLYCGNQHEVLDQCGHTVVAMFSGGIRSSATVNLFLHRVGVFVSLCEEL